MIGMFKIINKYIFEGKLDESVPKMVKTPQEEPALMNALAAFEFGLIKGSPYKIILVKHQQKCPFYEIVCNMIHEMIHMYDYCFGPLGQMIGKNIMVGQLNWGPGY